MSSEPYTSVPDQPVPNRSIPNQPTSPPYVANPSDTKPAVKRPGMVTFAAMMLFLIGGLSAASALMEFINATWLLFSPYNGVGGHLWLWGIIDAIYAVILLGAGYSILQGGQTGRTIGVIVAIFSAIRWLFFLPIAPITAVIIIAIDVLIIYALVAHEEFFQQSTPRAVL